ncbi:hypothetical protein [Kitasatospora sp. NPDC056531]|uniref:hypothetical protein n=1 Tax=Kitasatospora sp. NPDC056531 TaxID=3345856 RepID=UPI00368106FB
MTEPTQYYRAMVNILRPDGDMVTYYGDGDRQAGLTAPQLRSIVEAEALAWEPGGTVAGSRVSTDG